MNYCFDMFSCEADGYLRAKNSKAWRKKRFRPSSLSNAGRSVVIRSPPLPYHATVKSHEDTAYTSKLPRFLPPWWA